LRSLRRSGHPLSWRMDKSSSLGMPMHPKKYPRGTSVKAWGCPRGTPFFIGKNQVTFQYTIFLLLHALYIFLGASIFCFQFSSALFAAINVWITSCVWRETCSVFHCQEHSSFHSFRSTSVLFFCYCV
jgi:hypothetical protein